MFMFHDFHPSLLWWHVHMTWWCQEISPHTLLGSNIVKHYEHVDVTEIFPLKVTPAAALLQTALMKPAINRYKIFIYFTFIPQFVFKNVFMFHFCYLCVFGWIFLPDLRVLFKPNTSRFLSQIFFKQEIFCVFSFQMKTFIYSDINIKKNFIGSRKANMITRHNGASGSWTWLTCEKAAVWMYSTSIS